jgi:hypothetical protein
VSPVKYEPGFYIPEDDILHSHCREHLKSYTAFTSTGILLCYCAGKYLNWSMLATLGACIPVPFLICMVFIPETPRWYFSKGR